VRSWNPASIRFRKNSFAYSPVVLGVVRYTDGRTRPDDFSRHIASI